MYFDFDDHRPETPRVARAISVREGVLASIIVHLAAVIVLLLNPDLLSPSDTDREVVAAESAPPEPLRYVELLPPPDDPPDLRSTAAEAEREATTIEKAPEAANPLPFMRGNSPEMVDRGPSAEAPAAPPPGDPAESVPLPPDAAAERAVADRPAPARPAISSRSIAESLRNLDRYAQTERFDNALGGNVQQSADIEFDSMGVDFNPWLRRFRNQVMRNWIIPDSAVLFKGRVVIQFYVHRNGTMTDFAVVQPSTIPALTTAALNALKLSNPTTQLPAEYPRDRVFFTVSFHYNEDPRSYR